VITQGVGRGQDASSAVDVLNAARSLAPRLAGRAAASAAGQKRADTRRRPCTVGKRMASHASLRASDADRDAVAERLRHAAVEGRLEPDELEERLHAALRARTYGDLRRLLSDLPAKPMAWGRRGAEVMPAASTALAVALRVAIALAVVIVALVVAAVMAAWWTLWALVWLGLWARRACTARFGARARWDRARGPQRGRLAGSR
jgi:Domain of unknown function (DUF1707)